MTTTNQTKKKRPLNLAQLPLSIGYRSVVKKPKPPSKSPLSLADFCLDLVITTAINSLLSIAQPLSLFPTFDQLTDFWNLRQHQTTGFISNFGPKHHFFGQTVTTTILTNSKSFGSTYLCSIFDHRHWKA